MIMKTSNKRMRGFMCQSPAATAVCLTSDPRSVIMPRRPERTVVVDHTRLLNNAAKYSRLVEPHMLSAGCAANKRPVSMPILKQKDQLRETNPINPLQTTPAESVSQVVVMRVSIHCQGCAGKVRKHLSKMEGVTSFSIDLETRRVTVMGNISPVEVLESVSKVKKAEFWPC